MSRRPRGRARAAAPPPGRAAGGTTRETVPRLGSLALAAAALAVYLLQCPSVSGDKDSPELVIVLALNGVAHPTGYPLYTVLGHVFSRLAHTLGATWAYATNAWSAVGGTVAVYLLHRLALALVPAVVAARRVRFLVALLPAALFAFNPIWTYETTLAEVYSWHVAWVLGTALCFVRLVRELAAGEAPTPRRLHRHAALWGLLCGVGGAHHATSILVAAPLSIALLAMLLARRRMRAELLATLVAAVAVPLLAYGFTLWRATHPTPIDWWGLAPGLGSLLFHATGRQFGSLLGHFNPSPEQVGFLRLYVFPFLVPGLALSLAAAVRAGGPGERTLRWGLTVSALAGTAYAFGYGAVDPASYFLYPMALGLAGAVPIVAGLATAAQRRTGPPWARRAALVAAGLLAVATLALWPPWLQTGRKRTRAFAGFDRYVHSMWQAIPMDSAIVFWGTDLYYKLREYQLLAGEKPGVVVAHPRAMYMPGARARFIARTGIDPLADPEVAAYVGLPAYAPDSVVRRSIDAVENSVNRRSHLPVIHFDPEQGSVRLLLKPGADPGAAPASRREPPDSGGRRGR